ncbi:hypothetical protein MHH52_16560 [Paenibacillus sp. FSL K6-0276]|uniref:hypothetical protein n=1 Tax=Paenibacillus sp. FSL K6-0276 TaxID=2921450 RepID=UPI0030ECB636
MKKDECEITVLEDSKIDEIGQLMSHYNAMTHHLLDISRKDEEKLELLVEMHKVSEILQEHYLGIGLSAVMVTIAE